MRTLRLFSWSTYFDCFLLINLLWFFLLTTYFDCLIAFVNNQHSSIDGLSSQSQATHSKQDQLIIIQSSHICDRFNTFLAHTIIIPPDNDVGHYHHCMASSSLLTMIKVFQPSYSKWSDSVSSMVRLSLARAQGAENLVMAGQVRLGKG